MDKKGDIVRKDSGAWDKDYSQRGALWSGPVHFLPGLPHGSRVLELGCGNGKNLPCMFQRHWEVTAVDSSPCAVRMCKPITDSMQEGYACVADARCLPFSHRVFDSTIVVHVLSHLQSSDRILAAFEAARVLKKDGTLYFSGFSVEDFRLSQGCIKETGTTQNRLGIIMHYFTEQEVQDLFSNLHLQSIITKRWSLRIRGQDFARAEIQAVFIK